ncbi:MAG: hypothetical protein JO242_10755 [Streptosporangiaceae bacterium]|nr:hypothetical protein [Streptosporangiaceae bacterium]
MPVSTRIYIGGSLGFGGQPALDDLKTAGYSTVLVWSLHVQSNGDLQLNDTRIVHDGIYDEAEPLRLPAAVAQLRQAGMEILFSVGSGGSDDFTNIGNLLRQEPALLRANFAALKRAMTDAGGSIDGIDFDNEDNLDANVMIDFGRMLRDLAYAHVTFCPFGQTSIGTWGLTLSTLCRDQGGQGFVSAVHLQCYSGGGDSDVQQWQNMIASAVPAGQPRPLLIPGLATNQPEDGPWWLRDARGGSVAVKQGHAMDGQADWSKEVFRGHYDSAGEALQALQRRGSGGGVTFFFYCNESVRLGDRNFQPGDAVFFAGKPSWVSAAACDGYFLGQCSDRFNGFGACPSNLQSRYKTWSGIQPPPQGGFIWFYDSVVWCFLSGCCGSSEQNPGPAARDYSDAIVRGLSPSS